METVDNMQRDKTDSKAGGVPWSFLAVKTMMPVSSPTKHSAIRICLPCGPPSRPLWTTILESTTLAMRLWPWVPGRSWSTLVKVGCLRALESAAIVSVAYPGVVIEPWNMNEQTNQQWLGVKMHTGGFHPHQSPCLPCLSSTGISAGRRHREPPTNPIQPIRSNHTRAIRGGIDLREERPYLDLDLGGDGPGDGEGEGEGPKGRAVLTPDSTRWRWCCILTAFSLPSPYFLHFSSFLKFFSYLDP